ncbi:MAG: polyribonucleotide nucleotidyltransferase [Patescibacteria group bacterium]
MLQRKQYTIEVAGRPLTLEISPIAEQANAAVIVKYGETIALVTVVMSDRDSSANYMPLKVDYEEKFYAAGKILGSRFVRRETRPSEDAILAGRLVDRTIRPLFDSRMRRDLQVVVTILSYDEENDPEFVGLIGASTALGMSDVPWNGPVGGVRIAKIGGEIKINPMLSEVAKGVEFDAFVSGSRGKINMVELGGSDAKESDLVHAFTLAQKENDKLIEFQAKIIKELGKKKAEIALSEASEEIKAAVNGFLASRLEEAVYQPKKVDQKSKIAVLKDELMAHLKELSAEGGSPPSPGSGRAGASGGKILDLKAADFLFEEAIDELVHKNILEKEKRPDGRKPDQVRGLNGEVGLFERTHGSALFVRGNTQALAITTLAPPGAEQLIESMETNAKRRFLLHYNFPPYSVGETGSFRGPGRRDIGHGNLARKAVEPLVPKKDEFPYTIRVVSEILSSNGSSSMATVCSSVMSLMDAGVPIKKPAAGIAMGLMMEDEKNYKVLTDIQGPEDHHGDMDFKAAGTRDGVNAIQMDVKVDGVTVEILEKTLAQAKKARLEILDFMQGVIKEPKAQLSKYVPTIRQLKINPDKIGALIGPGGKVINGLIDHYELAGIDVDEDGGVFVSGNDLAKVEAAVKDIVSITREFKVGEIIEGNVIKILEFGAIVDLGGGKDGMIHVSELKNGYVKKVEDVVHLGDFVRAKIVRVEDDRIGLSMKQLQG